MLRALTRVLFDAVIVALALFLAAGTFAWSRAWILLGFLLVIRALSAVAIFRVNPALLRERATVLIHRDQPFIDKLILFAFMTTAFVCVPAIAALDTFRMQALPHPPLALSVFGLLLFTLGWIIIAAALRTNAFAVTVVRHQHEREQCVVDTGVYAFVRHPMYAGNPLVNVGLALWLGSYAAALFAIIPLALLMARIAHEEQFLLRELPGYREYTTRVIYKLIPGIW
ncbi:MAG: isoprenylcysteine carboxylmethyltransferase family protein [Gemmatimonadaceae bacterium]